MLFWSTPLCVWCLPQLARCDRSPLHEVKVKSPWLLTADIRVLTLLCIPAWSSVCTPAPRQRWHVQLSIFGFGVHCVYSLTHIFTNAHPHTHTLLVRICPSTQRSSPALLAAWLTHSSPAGGRNEPTLPVWTDLTERDYFKAFMDFRARPLLPIPLPWKWLIQSILMRSDG